MASFYSSFRARTPARGNGALFAIGWRAHVACRSRSAGVMLTDDAGTDAEISLADGTEVEILAWRPQTGETRYRVRSTGGGIEGWLAASNLAAKALPAKPLVAKTLVPKPLVAKPVAAKTPVAPAKNRVVVAPPAASVAKPLVSRGGVPAARRGKAASKPKTLARRGAA